MRIFVESEMDGMDKTDFMLPLFGIRYSKVDKTELGIILFGYSFMLEI